MPLLDDLNISKSLAYLHDLSKEIYNDNAIEKIKDFKKIYNFLGLEKKVKEEIPLDILTLAKEIQTARAAKDYAKADEIRAKITALNYNINYTKSGEIEVEKK